MAVQGNAKLFQDAPGQWIDALGLGAGAEDLPPIAGFTPPKSFRELAAAGIAAAENQDTLPRLSALHRCLPGCQANWNAKGRHKQADLRCECDHDELLR